MASRTTIPSILVIGFSVLIILSIWNQPGGKGGCESLGKAITKKPKNFPIKVLRSRHEMGAYLENSGFTTGAELGVNLGHFAKHTLDNWPSCQRYYLIDVWKHQENYHDIVNVDDPSQEQFFQEAKKRLEPFKSKLVYLRDFTSSAVHSIPDSSLDFVYVDARHDYCGTSEDIELYWPKLRPGGLMTGHDYKEAFEVPGQDWGICADGSRHSGAVKGAVDDFAAKNGLQVVVTYTDGWESWMMRKPIE